jgi:predicted  nucleic acid-binding Zn-ribbon protein
VLTLDQVRAQLTALNFDAGDADILLATMRARKADLDAAKQQRADAAAKAKTKSIDLGRFETLVRRGHRTIGEYSSLLASLGYDAGAVAAMGELLQLQIADDTAARDARAAAAAKATTIGLSLEQIRRAVILGVTSVDDFQTYLVRNKYTVDAQTVLLAELRDAVTEAEAARRSGQRRRARRWRRAYRWRLSRAPRGSASSTPDVYEQRLIDAGYTDDDIAIEMDLLAVEIADVQAARARAAAAKAASADRGLSLDQLARAVKLGVATIDDYRSRALALNYAAADVDTLVAVLEQDVQAVRDAEARRATIDGQLKPATSRSRSSTPR